MRFSFDRKILLGFISCVLVLLILAYVSFRNSERFVETNRMVSHTQEVLYELEQLLVASIELETSMRGYVIAGKREFLTPYENASLSIKQHLLKAKELTVDNPVQQENLRQLTSKLDERRSLLQRAIALRDEDGEKAAKFVSTGTGREAQQEIHNIVDIAKQHEYQLLRKREQLSSIDLKNFTSLFGIFIAVILIVLAILYVIITSNIKALRKAELEISMRNWNLIGSGGLIKVMQGNLSLHDLSRQAISFLADYVGAHAGTLYVVSDSTKSLKKISTYALGKSMKSDEEIALGEGISGQCAITNKMISVNDLSGSTFRVASGFGEIVPRNIIALPVNFESRVIGVVELASASDFTDNEKEYLKQVTDNLGIAIGSAKSREKVNELLEETQRQAEELEAQQEELRQSNEELTGKTEMLENSQVELKVQQEELQQANEELEERSFMLEDQKAKIENAKIEIEHKVKELEVTSKYKSEFLANMSHELRTPLNSVLILAQLLSENKNKNLTEREMEFARNICNSGNDLLSLINEILDLSKVEAGKIELEIEEIEISAINESVFSMFSEIAKSKSINFNIDYKENTLPHGIVSDRQRVEQIIRNLLSNAFKFTDKKGNVTLTISGDYNAQPFRHFLLSQGSVIAFSVKDDGIGIPKEKLDVIFEAFQQVDGSTKRKYGGTGLGLSISRELAHALGGEIQVESVEGKGSTFTLFLPFIYQGTNVSVARAAISSIQHKASIFPRITEQENSNSGMSKALAMHDAVNSASQEIVSVPQAQDDRNVIREKDKVILIIEDDEEFSYVLLEFVRDRNYKGIVAHQGSVGLSYARHYKPDAIILDMNLPVMDGVEVLKQLKNDPQLRHIPVQIISGYDRKKEGVELGAFDYARKPVSKDRLQDAFDKIEDFLQRKLKKLLVIEDNESQNLAIRELIGNGDVKSIAAYSGKEAMDMLNGDNFDCIIVDLGLPDMTGFDLLERIKESKNNHVPIIVYTGKELTKEDKAKLNKLSNTVVLKTADSQERLLDETTLFLHRVESSLPKEKQKIIRNLHKTEEVLRGKQVLVVDDDIRNVYSLTNVLEEEGIKCYTAENGKVALQLLSEHPDVDMVLMDVMMPEMDGYEATREIRKKAEYTKMPVIALTAKAMKGDREKCLAAGMSDYVPKPVNIEQLLSLMRVWLYK